jgi:hypothetical protein
VDRAEAAFLQRLADLRIEAEAELQAVEFRRTELKGFLAFARRRLRDAGVRVGPSADDLVLEAVGAHPGIRASLMPTATGLPVSAVKASIKKLEANSKIRRQGLGYALAAES